MRKLVQSILNNKWLPPLLLYSFLYGTCVAQELASLENPKKIEKVRQTGKEFALTQMLSAWEKQYNITFYYDSELLKTVTIDKDKAGVTVNFQGVEKVLTNLLSPLQLKCVKIAKDAYVIRPAVEENQPLKKLDGRPLDTGYNTGGKEADAYRLLRGKGLDNVINPADKTITGKVTNENAEPLPGVNIVVKNTTTGTVTDVNGNYSLNVPESATTLVFSSVGYTSEEVEIGNRTVVNLQMLPDIKALTEIVVVGYGTQKKRDLTGSMVSVKEEDIENIPVTAVDALLQGKAAGVQVVQSSGAPGNANFIRIRGNNSLFAENRPLFVVDGVPMNEITTNVLDAGGQLTTGNNDINANDIASIEILKDASATAIYGSRASNGVVLITTKRGSTGKPKFEFNMYTGVQRVWRKLDLLNAQQYEDLITESINNENEFRDPASPLPVPEAIRVNGIDTDWQDEIFRTAPISSYNLSMSAGNEKTQYYTSLSYFDQKGTLRGQAYDRITGRINIDHQALDKLKIGNSLTISRSENNRVFTDFNFRNPLGAALISRPNLPVRNEDGTFSQDNLDQIPNPVQLAEEITFNSTQKRVIGNVYLEYEPIQGLMLKTSWGVDNLTDRQERFIPNTLITDNVAQARAANYEELVWLIETTATYSRVLNKNNDFSVVIGNTLQKSEESLLRAGGSLAGSNIITTIATSVPINPQHFITSWGLVSYFGRVNFNHKDRYLLTATLRADGSSRFGENNRYGFFPSASVGWRISNEPFMQNLDFIDDLKIRASYGVVGNQEGIGDFSSLALYDAGRNYTSSFPGIGIGKIPNPNLGWESTEQTDIGIDITLAGGRINFTADAYLKITSDLLFNKQIPFTSGFNGTANDFNLGELENKGLELALNTQNLVGAFNWTTSFNISFNRNEVTFLPGFDPENPTASDFFIEQEGGFGTDGTRTVFRVGEPIGSFYGWFVEGIDPNTGGVLYFDTNGDGSLGLDDRTVFGNALPQHTGGLGNNFSYRGLDLSIFMQWSYGNEVYNQAAAVLERMTGFTNQNTDVLRRWQAPGDITDIPRATFNDVTNRYVEGANNNEISDRYLEDGSFLRIKDITLGYELSDNIGKSVNVQRLRIYGSVRNAVTFTDYSGFDPESQNTNAVTSIGVDYLTQPQPRTFFVGLDIQF